MNDILHANIFFFITSLAVILVTFLLAWGLYYVVGILKNVRDISDRLQRGSVELEADFHEFRTTVKQEGLKLTTLYQFFTKWVESFIPKKKKRAHPVRDVKKEMTEETPEVESRSE